MYQAMNLESTLALISTAVAVAIPLTTVQFFVMRLIIRNSILEAGKQTGDEIAKLRKDYEARLLDINNRLMDSRLLHLQLDQMGGRVTEISEGLKRLEDRVYVNGGRSTT